MCSADFGIDRDIAELTLELRGALDPVEAKQIEAELDAALAERAQRIAALERER